MIENVKRKPVGLIITIIVIIALLAALVLLWQKNNAANATLAEKSATLANVQEEHKAYIATLEANFQQEIQRVNEDWNQQLAAEKKRQQEKLARIYEEVNQIVYSSEDTLKYIDAMEAKLHQGKSLSETDVEKLEMLGAGLTYVQKQYTKPISEFKELDSFLAAQLDATGVPPKERYGLFQRMFGREYKEAVADYYKDEGRREAYSVARERVSTAYSSAQRQMAALSSSQAKYIEDLQSVIAGNEARAEDLENFFRSSRKVIDVHQSIMRLQDEQKETLPSGPIP